MNNKLRREGKVVNSSKFHRGTQLRKMTSRQNSSSRAVSGQSLIVFSLSSEGMPESNISRPKCGIKMRGLAEITTGDWVSLGQKVEAANSIPTDGKSRKVFDEIVSTIEQLVFSIQLN